MPLDVSVPVYGTISVYRGGSREDADATYFDMPGTAGLGADDQFGFSFGSVADVTDRDLEAVVEALAPHQQRLRDLKMGGCSRLTDRGVRHLARLPDLQELDASATRSVGAKGWNVLGRLPRLTWIGLEGAERPDDSTMEILGGMPALEGVNVDLCDRITDDGAEALARAPKLSGISLSGARLTDRGIGALARMPKLRSLALGSGVRMKDSSLHLLAKAPHLASLSLPNCSGWLLRTLRGHGISRKALASFQHAKPDCEIWSEEIWRERQRMFASL